MVTSTRVTGRVTRGRGLAVSKRTLGNVPATSEHGAMTRRMVTASMRIK